MEFIELAPMSRREMVEIAACMMAADGVVMAVERERTRIGGPHPGLSSDETIQAEELALKISKWIRDNADELMRRVSGGG